MMQIPNKQKCQKQNNLEKEQKLQKKHFFNTNECLFCVIKNIIFE